MNNWVLAASQSIKQGGQILESGVILKVCIDFMSGKNIRIFSHLINPSHCRYGSKLITAEVTSFHLMYRLEDGKSVLWKKNHERQRVGLMNIKRE